MFSLSLSLRTLTYTSVDINNYYLLQTRLNAFRAESDKIKSALNLHKPQNSEYVKFDHRTHYQ